MIPVAKPYISNKEKEYIVQAVDSGWVSSTGPFVNSFEEQLAKFLGCKYVTTASNGTTALHLSLLGLGIGPGDEVVLPAFSFIATLNAILYTGAKPVFVDVKMDDWGLDPALVEQAITPRTKAIMAVHLYGYACDILSLKSIADKHKLYLIEDNAESFGAEVSGKKLGTIGDIGSFSFYGNKIITTGEGGAVATNNEEIMKKILVYKNHGRKTNKIYYHDVLGYNYRMTNLQAALGLAQLEQVDLFLAERKRIEIGYDNNLKNLLRKQKDNKNSSHVNWLYACLLKDGVDVEKFMAYLGENGVDSRRLFLPMNKMPYLPKEEIEKDFPVSNYLYEHGINLPTFIELKDEEIKTICEVILKYE